MSKDLAFEQMVQESAMITALEHGEIRFPNTMTKKQAVEQGKEAANKLVNDGEIDVLEALSNFARLEEVIKSFVGELRKNAQVPEKSYNKNGVTFEMRNTGDRLDYEQDEVYKELKDKLKAREELLKLAYKSKDTIYDSDGVEVMKVGVKTYGKDTLIIKY